MYVSDHVILCCESSHPVQEKSSMVQNSSRLLIISPYREVIGMVCVSLLKKMTNHMIWCESSHRALPEQRYCNDRILIDIKKTE